MRILSARRILGWTALVAIAFAVAACGGRVSKDLVTQASNIPASFDVTLIADKDNQFDYDPDGGTNGAPLTEEDLRSALRYRKEQNLPCATVIVKARREGAHQERAHRRARARGLSAQVARVHAGEGRHDLGARSRRRKRTKTPNPPTREK